MAWLGYVCPVPKKNCNGKPTDKDGGLFHRDLKELMECKERHLKSQGYIKVGTREWKDPKDGRILMLSRKPGRRAKCRKGKEGRGMKPFHGITPW